MIKLKGGDPQEWHEGDMCEDIAERDLLSMSMSELVEWARAGYESEVKSWPLEVIREKWEGMQ